MQGHASLGSLTLLVLIGVIASFSVSLLARELRVLPAAASP